MIEITTKLLTFGLNEEYEVFILLDKDNQIPSSPVTDPVIGLNSLVNSVFENIFKYSSLFSPPSLFDAVLDKEGLTVYYYNTVPCNTLKNNQYKWIKPYETTAKSFVDDNRIKLSVSDYQAIHTALGRRQGFHQPATTDPNTGK